MDFVGKSYVLCYLFLEKRRTMNYTYFWKTCKTHPVIYITYITFHTFPFPLLDDLKIIHQLDTCSNQRGKHFQVNYTIEPFSSFSNMISTHPQGCERNCVSGWNSKTPGFVKKKKCNFSSLETFTNFI